MRLMLALLLAEFVRQLGPERPEACAEEHLKLVICRMLEDYRHPWKVEELSRMAQMSPSYFTRLCRRVYGKSPIGMLIDRRMERAQAMLGRENVSVSQACDRAGFTRVYYFSRLFKKRCGVPPTLYARTVQTAEKQ